MCELDLCYFCEEWKSPIWYKILSFSGRWMSESWKCCWDLVLPVQLILLWRLQKLISGPVVVVKRGESLINLPKPLRWKTNITSHESWPLFLHFLPSPHPTFPQSPQASSVVGRLGRGKKENALGTMRRGKGNFSLFPLSTVYLLLFCIATVFFFSLLK